MGSQANGSQIGFMIALSMTTLTFSGVVFEASKQASTSSEASEEAALGAKAETLADIVFGQAGMNWFKDEEACYTSGAMAGQYQMNEFRPDQIGESGGRFGLAEESCATERFLNNVPNAVSFDKIKSLNEARLAAVAGNDLVEYEEARKSLGLQDEFLEFRVDTLPSLKEDRAAVTTASGNPLFKILYIGDWRSFCSDAGQQLPPPAPSVPGPGGTTWVECDGVESDVDAKVCPAIPVPGSPCLETQDVGVTAHPTMDEEMRSIAGVAATFDQNVRIKKYSSENRQNPLNESAPPYDKDGDVIPDLPKAIRDELPKLLQVYGEYSTTNYNVVVVGSGVTNLDMYLAGIGTSQSTPSGARELMTWVREAGGTLIILGGDQNLHWASANPTSAMPNAKFVPLPVGSCPVPTAECTAVPTSGDTGLLEDPNTLDWKNYRHNDRAWRFVTPKPTTGNSPVDFGAKFDHVLTSGSLSLLSVSKEGAFDKGTVVLTSFTPAKLLPSGDGCPPSGQRDQTNCEASKFFRNLLNRQVSQLTLDYGPKAPTDAPVASSCRVLTVYHPSLGDPVEVSACLKAWTQKLDYGIPDSDPLPPDTFPFKEYIWTDTRSTVGFLTPPAQDECPQSKPYCFHNEFRVYSSTPGRIKVTIEDFYYVSGQFQVIVWITKPGASTPISPACTWTIPDPAGLLVSCSRPVAGLAAAPAGEWSVMIDVNANQNAVGTLTLRGDLLP